MCVCLVCTCMYKEINTSQIGKVLGQTERGECVCECECMCVNSEAGEWE